MATQLMFLMVLASASIWDGFTTMYGILHALGKGHQQMIAAGIFMGIIIALLLNTKKILFESDSEEFSGILLRIFWMLAIGYDIYSSWMGNQAFLIKGNSIDAKVILAGLTLMVSGSPVLISLLWEQWRRKA